MTRRLGGAWAAIGLCLSLGCAAVYPEIKTPLRAPPAGRALEPPPPVGLYYIGFKEADVPEKTRDGRPWHELGSKLPDAFGVLYVNGKELIRTHKESSTLHPTWPESPKGNFRIQPADRVRVELWEASLVDKVICVKDLGAVQEEWVTAGRIDVACDGGAHIVISWEAAHGQQGFGMYYELRAQRVFVTRMYEESPAARAGIKPGDEIGSFGSKLAKDMKAPEIQSFMNAPKAEGVVLGIRHGSSEMKEIELKEGGVYPLFEETGLGGP